MKFLIAVLMIHLIVALLDNRIKQKNSNKAEKTPEETIKHPAEFLLR